MANTLFFKDKRLPFIELRYTKDSNLYYKPHFHQTFSIGAIEEGQVYFRINNNEYTLQKEEIVLINPEIIHSCNPINNQNRSYYMLYLDKDWIYNLQKTLNCNIQNFIPFYKVLIKNSNLYNNFIVLSKNLLDSNIFLLEKEEILEAFILSIINQFCEFNKIQTIYEDINKVIKIKEYLKENLTQNPTIDDISKALNISRYHLIRLFKQSTNITPHAYLLNLKVEYTKELLKSGMNIAEVAISAGFNDQSHLNRVFKQISACTPYEYKK